MKCCNNDCNQGRDCPHKTNADRTTEVAGAMRTADVVFMVVMLIITATVAVSIMWWVITAVLMFGEVLK